MCFLSLQVLAPYRRIRPDLVVFSSPMRFSLSFQVFFTGGVLLSRLVDFHLFLASLVSFSGVFQLWCSSLGDKPQSTWRLFGGRFRRVSFGGGRHCFCLAQLLGFLGSSRFSNPVLQMVWFCFHFFSFFILISSCLYVLKKIQKKLIRKPLKTKKTAKILNT